MFWCDFIAGWIGGCVGIITGHPFDTIKVRQQAFKDSSLTRVTLSCLKHEGVQGLFKGMLYPMLSAGALNSLFFGMYGVSLRGLMFLRGAETGANSKPNYVDIYLAACGGGVAQLVVACPIDLAKIKLQTQTGHENPKIFRESHFKGPNDVMKSIYKQYGVRGLYRGLTVMAWRDLPAWGLYMVLYDWLLKQCKTKGSVEIVLAGGAAGVVSWMSIIPLDVVKSRIQADNPENPQYKGSIDCIRQCYKEGGLRIFSRGLLVTSLRAFPVNGSTFLAYEYFLTLCQKFHTDE